MRLYFGTSEALGKIHRDLTHNSSRAFHDFAIPDSSLFLEIRGNSFYSLFFLKKQELILIGDDFFVLTEGDMLSEEHLGNDLPSMEIGRFITFFRTEKMYVSLLNVIGKTKFFSALNKLREYSYLINEKGEVNFFKGIIDKDIFIMEKRSKEFRYLADVGYRRFVNEFFKRNYNADVTIIETSFNLRGSGSLRIGLNFNADSIVESNMFALIGKNGVGKSQALKAFKKDEIKKSNFQKVLDVNLSGSVNKVRSNDAVTLRIDLFSRLSFVSSLQSLLMERKRYFYYDAIEILKEFFTVDLECSDVLIPLIGRKEASLWKMRFAPEEIDLNSNIKLRNKRGEFFILSQGQEYLASLVFLLLLHIEPYSLILIDEPEVYLHPNLIKRMQLILERILRQTKSKAILSTHSIFLVRELPKEFVIVVGRSNEVPYSRHLLKETFGASLDRLADEIFYDEEVETGADRFVAEYRRKNKKIDMKKMRNLPAGLASRILAYD